jgi:hypothetical protein
VGTYWPYLMVSGVSHTLLSLANFWQRFRLKSISLLRSMQCVELKWPEDEKI